MKTPPGVILADRSIRFRACEAAHRSIEASEDQERKREAGHSRNVPTDYGLQIDDHIVGVVEAKKVTRGPEGVLTQTERCARGIRDGAHRVRKYGVPFVYSTNGEVIWFHDVRDRASCRGRASAEMRSALGRVRAEDDDVAPHPRPFSPNEGSPLKDWEMGGEKGEAQPRHEARELCREGGKVGAAPTMEIGAPASRIKAL